MSAAETASAAGAALRSTRDASRGATAIRPARSSTRIPLPLAFMALALLAGLRFSALMTPAPVLRGLGIVAVATAAAVALRATGSVPPRFGPVLRIAIVVVGAWLAFVAAGASVYDLWPWHWGTLAHSVTLGFNGFDGHWPLADGSPDSRTAVMLGCAVTLLGAAALLFWPTTWRVGARTAAALGVLLTVYTTAAVNQPTAGWPLQGLLLCAGAWLWIGASWPSARSAPATRSPGAGPAAAWIALASVAGLLVAASLLAAAPLLNYHSWNPFAGSYPATNFDWNQQYGPLDQQRAGEEMFTVHSSAPRLWRVTTLDRFDGTGFVQSTPPTIPTALANAVSGSTTSAEVQIRGLRSTQLVSPGQAFAVVLHGVSLPRLGSFSADGTVDVAGLAPLAGDSYTVTAFVPNASPAALRQAPRSFPAALAAYTQIELPDGDLVSLSPGASEQSPEHLVVRGDHVSLSAGDTAGAPVRQVAASPYAGVLALAQRLRAGAATNYDVVARIQSYLRRAETYSLTPPRSTYPLTSFLLDTHIGYCQQFSGAMALLLRLDGIPARVVAGFQSGTRDGSGNYVVTGRDAHEWVEAYFTGVGWVPFDPTPPAAAAATASTPVTPSDPDATAAGAATVTGAPSLVVRRRDIGLGGSSPARHPGGASHTGLMVLLAAALLAGVGGCVFLLLVRRRRDGDRVEEFAAALRLAGLKLPPSTTLVQLERRLGMSYGLAASRYAALLRTGRYADDHEPSGPSNRDRRRLRRVLGAHRGPLLRLRLLLALPPGRRGA